MEADGGGGRKSFTYDEVDKRSASEGAGICWSIIWNRFRWIWMAGKRRMGAEND